MNINRLIKKAKSIADSLPNVSAQQKLVAFALDSKGRIISIGQNSYHKSHTRQAFLAKIAGSSDKQYLHAEIHAILKSNLRSGRSRPIDKLFVFRFLKDGNFGLASPCEVCRLAIKEAGIREIGYSSTDGVFVTEFFLS